MGRRVSCQLLLVALSLAMLLLIVTLACNDAGPTQATIVSALPIPTPFPTSLPISHPTVTANLVKSSPTSSPVSETPTHSATPTAAPTETLTPTFSPSPTPIPPTASPACTETSGRIEIGEFFSPVIGQEQSYRVYLPPCYDHSDAAYPVLYMLHGYPFDDSHWDDIGIDEAADVGIADGTLPPFIIAMPAADNEGTFTNTSGGPRSFEGVVLNEFIPFIEANYRAVQDAQGRAIGGMSRGAVWSLEIAFRNPDRFAAVGGHSAALNVNRAPPVYDPLQLAAVPTIRSLRIFLDAGQNDWVLPGVEDLHAALTAAGVNHDYRIFEGYHNDSYWSAHVGDYLAFYAADW